MSHKPSGLWCDLCSKPILQDPYYFIKVKGKDGHSCGECKKRYEANADNINVKPVEEPQTRSQMRRHDQQKKGRKND